MKIEDKNIIEKIEFVLSNYPKYRLAQVKRAIFVDLIENWNETSYLPKDIIEKLDKIISLEIRGMVKKSKDGSMKAVIYFHDNKSVESVLIPHEKRSTICISSQVGCPIGCSFCATGQKGFSRNLSIDEIIFQFLFFSRILKIENKKIDSIVFMGMGEPFLNYDNVLGAAKIISKEFNIGARRISFSTSGIIKGIERLSKEKKQFNLAISLHAPNDMLRQKIMPINNSQGGIKKLMKAVSSYIKTTKRRVMIEYILLKDINDSYKHAQELANLLNNNLPKLFFVNLIKYNPTLNFQPSDNKTIRKFKEVIRSNGIEVVERQRFGQDIKGACGQLADF